MPVSLAAAHETYAKKSSTIKQDFMNSIHQKKFSIEVKKCEKKIEMILRLRTSVSDVLLREAKRRDSHAGCPDQ